MYACKELSHMHAYVMASDSNKKENKNRKSFTGDNFSDKNHTFEQVRDIRTAQFTQNAKSLFHCGWSCV